MQNTRKTQDARDTNQVQGICLILESWSVRARQPPSPVQKGMGNDILGDFEWHPGMCTLINNPHSLVSTATIHVFLRWSTWEVCRCRV